MLRSAPLSVSTLTLATLGIAGAALTSPSAQAQGVPVLIRASVSSAGEQAFGDSRSPRITFSGRCVTFASFANNLDPIGSLGRYQAFVRDLELRETDLVSEAPGAQPGNGDSGVMPPASSDDCRFVAFDSTSTNLVGGDTNGQRDVFLRDRLLGTTTLVSAGLGGAGGNGYSYAPVISGDGAWVAFESDASNLVAGDANNGSDVFLWNRGTQQTVRLAFDPLHDAHMRWLQMPSMSSNGDRIAVASLATAVPEEGGGFQIWVIQRVGASGTLVSTTGAGEAGDRNSTAPHLSADGLWVTFQSQATNFTPGCAFLGCDAIYRVSASGGSPLAVTPADADNYSTSGGVGNSGALVAFSSLATNLVAGDDAYEDAFLGGPGLPAIQRLSSARSGGPSNSNSSQVSCDATCGRVAFLSRASDLVRNDTNFAADVFVSGVLFRIFEDGFESGDVTAW